MLTITDTLITSDTTDHHAAKLTRNGVWRCSWLPAGNLTAEQAKRSY